jgi:MFS family permease
MGGINLVVYYITQVLQDNVGLTRNLSLLLGGVINAMFLIGSLLPTFYLDQMGRRGPMMWGSFGLGISMMLIAILLSFQDRGGSIAKSTSAASVTFFFTYMLIFGGTANCIPWVYVPEILPLHVRAKGTAVGISSNWIWNFFVVMVTPTLLTNLKWKGYLIFMCLNFAFVPLVYFVYPETTNLTLEEIDWLFMRKHAVRESLRVQKEGWGDVRWGSVGGAEESGLPRRHSGEESTKEKDETVEQNEKAP